MFSLTSSGNLAVRIVLVWFGQIFWDNCLPSDYNGSEKNPLCGFSQRQHLFPGTVSAASQNTLKSFFYRDWFFGRENSRGKLERVTFQRCEDHK